MNPLTDEERLLLAHRFRWTLGEVDALPADLAALLIQMSNSL